MEWWLVGWLLAPTYPSGCFDGELWLLSTIYWNDSHGEAFVYMSRIKKRSGKQTARALYAKEWRYTNDSAPLIQGGEEG